MPGTKSHAWSIVRYPAASSSQRDPGRPALVGGGVADEEVDRPVVPSHRVPIASPPCPKSVCARRRGALEYFDQASRCNLVRYGAIMADRCCGDLSVLDWIRIGLLGARPAVRRHRAAPARGGRGPAGADRAACCCSSARVIVLAELTKEAQVFDVIATRLAIVGRGNYLALFLLCAAFASVITIFLNLDTTAVLLTPVMLALAARTGIAAAAAGHDHGLAGQHRQPAAAGLEPDQPARRRPGRAVAPEFAGRMWSPQLVSITVTMVFLWVFYWRRGRRGADRYDAAGPGAGRRPGAVPYGGRGLPAVHRRASCWSCRSRWPPRPPRSLVIAAFAVRDRVRLHLRAVPVAAADLRDRPVPGGADPRAGTAWPT